MLPFRRPQRRSILSPGCNILRMPREGSETTAWAHSLSFYNCMPIASRSRAALRRDENVRSLFRTKLCSSCGLQIVPCKKVVEMMKLNEQEVHMLGYAAESEDVLDVACVTEDKVLRANTARECMWRAALRGECAIPAKWNTEQILMNGER